MSLFFAVQIFDPNTPSFDDRAPVIMWLNGVGPVEIFDFFSQGFTVWQYGSGNFNVLSAQIASSYSHRIVNLSSRNGWTADTTKFNTARGGFLAYQLRNVGGDQFFDYTTQAFANVPYSSSNPSSGNPAISKKLGSQVRTQFNQFGPVDFFLQLSNVNY